MEYTSKIHLGKEVSLVLQLIDDYLGIPVGIGSAKVSLSCFSSAPIYKEDGYVVFCGLLPQYALINIQSDIYMNRTFSMRIDSFTLSNPVIRISLKPRKSYTFGASATLVRLTVTDRYDEPVKDAYVQGQILGAANIEDNEEDSSRNCFRAIIARGVKKGSTSFLVSSISGSICAGDKYMIFMNKDKKELCTIKDKTDGRLLSIKKPLLYDYERDCLLLPVIQTITDYKGEAVIYFRSLSEKDFTVGILVKKDQRTAEGELQLKEGISKGMRIKI